VGKPGKPHADDPPFENCHTTGIGTKEPELDSLGFRSHPNAVSTLARPPQRRDVQDLTGFVPGQPTNHVPIPSAIDCAGNATAIIPPPRPGCACGRHPSCNTASNVAQLRALPRRGDICRPPPGALHFPCRYPRRYRPTRRTRLPRPTFQSTQAPIAAPVTAPPIRPRPSGPATAMNAAKHAFVLQHLRHLPTTRQELLCGPGNCTAAAARRSRSTGRPAMPPAIASGLPRDRRTGSARCCPAGTCESRPI